MRLGHLLFSLTSSSKKVWQFQLPAYIQREKCHSFFYPPLYMFFVISEKPVFPIEHGF